MEHTHTALHIALLHTQQVPQATRVRAGAYGGGTGTGRGDTESEPYVTLARPHVTSAQPCNKASARAYLELRLRQIPQQSAVDIPVDAELRHV